MYSGRATEDRLPHFFQVLFAKTMMPLAEALFEILYVSSNFFGLDLKAGQLAGFRALGIETKIMTDAEQTVQTERMKFQISRSGTAAEHPLLLQLAELPHCQIPFEEPSSEEA